MRVLVLLCVLLCSAVHANDVQYDFTFYGVSQHLTNDKDYNEQHDLISIEYRIDDMSYGVAKFVNSYNIGSVLINVNKYLDTAYDNIEVGLHAGLVTGYYDSDACIIAVGKLCQHLAVSMAYTEYSVVPRITYLGNAFVFSLSYRF